MVLWKRRRGILKLLTGNIDIYIYILDVVDIDLEIKRIAGRIQKGKPVA
ncbi:MAG: hypothetical protein U5N58_05365 [Actinomycetota bacterium]|nr:hypothetical protein [Actinomycetota bacterium]